MEVNSKIKSVRVCTFKEDYFSPSCLRRKAAAEKAGTPFYEEPIYKKGSVHAMDHTVAALIRDKGAKMEVKEFDEEGAIKRAQEVMRKNKKKEHEMMYA